MSRPTRRQMLGALAAAGAITWVSDGHARASARRVRPGADITLRCPRADAFRVQMGDDRPQVLSAPGGAVVFAAPGGDPRVSFTALRATPLAAGRPVGEPVSVEVFTRRPGYGA